MVYAKTSHLRVRMNRDELELYHWYAGLQDMSLSDFVRTAVREKIHRTQVAPPR